MGTATTYEYDGVGNLVRTTSPIDNTAYTYSTGNFITGKITSNSAGTVLQTDNYTYKSDGNVGTENDKTYTYDTQNRLSNVLKGTNNTSYTFDERGNRSVKMYNGNNSYTYTYDKNNRLLQFDDGTYRSYPSYDDRGNLDYQTVATYDYGVTVEYFDASYDGFNRLESVVTFSDSAQYEYNSDGIRTAKTVNGTRTEFVLDGINVIAENKDGSFTDYIRGVTGLIYLKKPNGTKLYYVKIIMVM